MSGVEPKFVPRPGQMDFTHARWAPGISCVIRNEGKILLVQRSSGMRWYPSLWNGIGGFLDDQRSLEEKVMEELHEEAGIEASDISSITLLGIYDYDDPSVKKTWVMHAVLVDVKTQNVKLDWEAEKFAWVTKEDAFEYDLLPSYKKLLMEYYK